MLAYAASRPRIGARQSSPNAMLLVICAHIIVIALVMSAKMTMPPHKLGPPTALIRVRLQPPPPPQPVKSSRPDQPRTLVYPTPQPEVVSPSAEPTRLDQPIAGAGGSLVGEIVIPDLPPLPPQPLPTSSAAELLTPVSDLKPPYPEAKLLTGEEATLTLRLLIDDHGRVMAVDPVGAADPVFFAAARKHLLAHWRYKPAMKDGRAVGSTIVIKLRFELDG